MSNGCGQCCACRRNLDGYTICYHTGACNDCQSTLGILPLRPQHPTWPAPNMPVIGITVPTSEELVLQEILKTLKDIQKDLHTLKEDVAGFRMNGVKIK